ncbi:MAG: ABC transporter permease [Acidobacteriota bacterium]|nr:ABC transporter permease [Acidobacteriota bacterium]
MLDTLRSDVRYTARWLRRSPGFTVVAILTLAIGIGFNTALFSVVDAVLFRPLPVRAPSQLVDVYTTGPAGEQWHTTSYPDFRDLREKNDVFSDMMAYSEMFTAVNLPDRSRLVLGEVVTGNYFQVLGVQAARGRTLLPDDDRPGATRAVVVSNHYWRRDLDAAPDIVGQPLRIKGQVYTIVGVAPASFTGMLPMLSPEIWVPMTHVDDVQPSGMQEILPSPAGTTRLEQRGTRWLFVKGRLKPGVSIAQAQANLNVLMRGIDAANPDTNKNRTIDTIASSRVRIHPDADRLLRPIGLGLMVVVGLVLLIACANVASMLLARASARQREIGIRLAIGASRGRLVQQLLTESLVTAGLGAIAGLGLAWALIHLAMGVTLPIPIPLTFDLQIDGRALVFTVIVTLAAGLLAGLAPALNFSKAALTADLKGEEGATRAGGRRWTLRDGLVAGQMAVTMLLLVIAGLLTRGLVAAQQVNVGFHTGGLAIVSTELEMAGYDAARSKAFYDRALEQVRALPGVESAALADRLPFSIGYNMQRVFVPGRHQAGDKGDLLMTARVSPDYFKTIGVPIVEGRNFTAADTPSTPNVVIISEAMAKRYWPGQDPIGKVYHARSLDGPAYQVVGVTADYQTVTVGETPQPYIHLAESQQPDTGEMIVARTRGDAAALVGVMQRTLLAMEPNLVFLDHQTMDTQVDATLFPVRAAAWLVAVVGVVALLLAAIGLYGVIAYAVARRTREIGVRMALGARPGSVLALVMRQGLAVAAIGLLAGGVLAAGAVRGLASLMYGVSLADPMAWGAAAFVLLVVAALANFVPARRAARIDPATALRME